MGNPLIVVVNASAGGKYDAAWAAQLTRKFADAGISAKVVLAADGAAMIAAARAAVTNGARAIVAGGGDGTINTVASVVAKTDCALGVLALGTLNHFAKDLGIPLGLDEAIAVIAAGVSTKVDTGEVNGKLFLNNSSLGLYPTIVRDREHQQHRFGRGKWLAFASATISALRRYPFLNARLKIEGVEHLRKTPFVFIGNNAYSMSGFTLGQRETLTAGVLSLYVAQRTSRFGLLRLALRALFGRLRQARDFDALLVREIVIETRHRQMQVATDGEVTRMSTPLHYRIHPQALRVLIPADGAAASAVRPREH